MYICKRIKLQYVKIISSSSIKEGHAIIPVPSEHMMILFENCQILQIGFKRAKGRFTSRSRGWYHDFT